MASLGALRLSESAASAQVAETNVGGGSVVASSTPLLPPQLAAASGAIQGAAQNLVKQLVLHPLDTIKTRVQMPSELSRAELFRDLYRGLIPTIVGGTPGSSAFFAAKEAMTSVLKPRGLPPQVVTVAGVVAGVLSAKSIKTPFDVAQTRAMATGPGQSESAFAWDGSWSAVQAVYEKEGLQGLYRGYGANVAYKLPADAAKFLSYEALRESGAAGQLPAGVAGGAATLISNAITTPLDVVRTRILTRAETGDVVETFRSVLAQQDGGWQLWSGVGWRLARGALAGSIQFSVLEGTKSAVESRV